MQNQIRQLEDGTFKIGTWIQNANGEVVFFDATSAKTLEEANKIADELDDQEFKLAKSEIDMLGGIQGANKVLELMNENEAVAVEFDKNHFDINELKFYNQKDFEQRMDDYLDNGETATYLYADFEIQSLLHKTRFLKF
ncbi:MULTISPECIES: hypothetical protein [Acinetobacter calcoaceticus/baumannii complex]|uniref:hypothetical protein n=1 Tax=Acinetobacter calcoaceticus/baumannii complex TaxID=909768 RepID=UPI00044C01C4|nr:MULTISPECIES: hypothetical protein [Acinetobacter calcoaceticus/baumannii complex]EXA93404.1 hypothetical protein J507_3940 [Acinetobacter sp. 1295259]MCG9487361.1 hypothetical protein [Acinetobacter pittii]OTM74963.1 hypothetical protein B9X97_11620 [Acinetobacter pittii]RQL73863.1 hypothetical protein BJI55_03300 [Acinetobacter pittii]RSO70422.1 hypothetical protein EA754_19605 [Acinetobacter pittii]